MSCNNFGQCYSITDELASRIGKAVSVWPADYRANTPQYPGAFEVKVTKNNVTFWEKVYIKEVIYSNPATIVVWSDGTKTISKCSGGDTYDKKLGLSICITKKVVGGGAKLIKVYDAWGCDGEVGKVTLADVRKKQKVK